MMELKLGREAAWSFVGFAVVTYFVFWPVFLHPGLDVFQPFTFRTRVDVDLVLWILSTVAENLVSNPLHLFAGNTLYPAPAPVMFSEHLLSQQVSFAPIYLATGNAVLGMQVTLLFNIAMCGTAMYLLLRHWGCSVAAAVLGGIFYAFTPTRYHAAFAPHTSAVQYLPLAILFLDRSLDHGRWRDALAFALSLALQMLTSFYLAYVTVFVIAPYLLAKLALRRNLARGGLARAALAALAAGVVFGVVSYPYFSLSAAGSLTADAAPGANLMSAVGWRSYLYPSIVAREWPGWWIPGMSLYLGIFPIAFAIVGLFGRSRPFTRTPAVPLLAAMFVTYVLSLGVPRVPEDQPLRVIFAWISSTLPGFSAMRAPGRFAMGVFLCVAAFAGFGVDVAVQRARRRGINTAAIYASLSLVAVLAGLDFGIAHFRFETRRIPWGIWTAPIYQALRDAPPGPVLEVPGGVLEPAMYRFAESEAGLYSLYHRHPTLNGYTGHFPNSYLLLMSLARALPDPRAVDLLGELCGLRYLVVHESKLSAIDRKLWRRSDLIAQARFGNDVLYELPAIEPVLLPGLMGRGDGASTLVGTPLRPLAPEEMQMSIGISPAEEPAADLEKRKAQFMMRIRVRVANRSPATWPVLSLDASQAVHWVYRWEDSDGRQVGRERSRRMAFDLGPGESVSTTLHLFIPKDGNRLDLVIGLRQGDTWFPETIRLPARQAKG